MANAATEKLMKTLGLTEQEALELQAYDKAVDHNEKTEFDLTAEQQKVAKQYTKAGTRKPTVYKFDTAKRQRKSNPTKSGIITEIATFLQENSEFCPEKVEISNKERQIDFAIGDVTYSITLTQHRKPKN